MNAPTTPPAVTTLSESLEFIPLHLIRVSTLPVQSLRRERLTPEGLLELAASIKALGVQQPIVVRPLVQRDITARYEIVCGERRFLAADRAGLPAVPAVIRELDETAALEVLMSENLGREDMGALEEGAGFKALMDAHRCDAETVGAKFGKSRSYVYGRLKLLALIPDGRSALQQGKLDPSKALLIARLAGDKAQTAALKAALETDWRGNPLPYATLFDRVRSKHLQPLAGVPWALDDATLGDRQGAALPACSACPSFSGNDPALAGDQPDAHMCADAGCHAIKTRAAHARRRLTVERAGQTIVSGDAAKKLLPGRDTIVGHLDLDQVCYEDEYTEDEPEQREGETDDAFGVREDAWQKAVENYPQRTYRVLLAAAGLPVTHVEDPKTKAIRELVPLKPARDYLATHHNITLPGWVGKGPAKGTSPAEQAAERAKAAELQRQQTERQTAELEYRAALFKSIAAKCHGPLTRDELIDLADRFMHNVNVGHELKAIYGKTPEPADLKPAELPRLIRLCLLAQSLRWVGANPKPLLAAAKRWKVDAAAVKKQCTAAAKAPKAPNAPKPAAATKPAAKQKGKAK